MQQISGVQRIVLNFTAAHLFNCDINISENINWRDVYYEAKAQSVAPIVYSVAEPYMDDKSVEFWKSQIVPKVANNIRIQCEHVELHEIMSLNNIPYTTLKGFAAALYYPDPIQRSMGDVDFLIKEKDFKRTGLILEEAGFIKSIEDDGDVKHVAYLRETNGMTLYDKDHTDEYKANVSNWEMHRRVNGIPGGNVGKMIDQLMSDVIETAVIRETDSGEFMIPDIFHHGLILLLHTASHMTSEGVGLRHLCDWAVFVESLSDEDFCDLFEKKLKSIGMWKFAQLLTACSVKYLNCTEKKWVVIDDESILENIMSDILNGGNFGKKDVDRYRQIKYISNRGEGTIDNKGSLRQVINTINEKARNEIGLVKRIPITMPIGWLIIGIKYIKLIIKGERTIDNKNTLKEANERKNIYRHFKLFEIE